MDSFFITKITFFLFLEIVILQRATHAVLVFTLTFEAEILSQMSEVRLTTCNHRQYLSKFLRLQDFRHMIQTSRTRILEQPHLQGFPSLPIRECLFVSKDLRKA